MLTLTRKVGESIRIGDDIEIVVKEIRKNQVRIGIVAPRDVKIFREEVYQNIVAENRQAASSAPADLGDIILNLAPSSTDAGDADASAVTKEKKGPPGRKSGGTNGNAGRGDV